MFYDRLVHDCKHVLLSASTTVLTDEQITSHIPSMSVMLEREHPNGRVQIHIIFIPVYNVTQQSVTKLINAIAYKETYFLFYLCQWALILSDV